MSERFRPASSPRLKTPAGACDTHMHFYDARFETAPSAHFTPPDARVEDYRAIQSRLGLERVVVVQPTTYGLDNACQLEAMASFGDNARGVMVADSSTSDAELERMAGLGVCGVRFHMLPGGALPWDILEETAARVSSFGWHIQLQMNGRDLPGREAMLQDLPCALVIDHVGRFMDPVAPDHPAFLCLLRLIDNGRCWVKLSAPYESSRIGPLSFSDISPAARALVTAAPERMLWASNWPHPNQENRYDEADLLDLLLEWVDDESTRNRILVDNPAELYRF